MRTAYFPDHLSPNDPGTALALIVGVSDYSGLDQDTRNDLPGACNDVIQWWEYFTETLGIPAENICVLSSPVPGSKADEWVKALAESGRASRVAPATRSNILGAFFSLAEKLSGGTHTGIATWSGIRDRLSGGLPTNMSC